MTDNVFRDPDSIRGEFRSARAAINAINARIAALMRNRGELEDRADELRSELQAQGEDVLTAGELDRIRTLVRELDEEAGRGGTPE